MLGLKLNSVPQGHTAARWDPEVHAYITCMSSFGQRNIILKSHKFPHLAATPSFTARPEMQWWLEPVLRWLSVDTVTCRWTQTQNQNILCCHLVLVMSFWGSWDGRIQKLIRTNMIKKSNFLILQKIWKAPLIKKKKIKVNYEILVWRISYFLTLSGLICVLPIS